MDISVIDGDVVQKVGPLISRLGRATLRGDLLGTGRSEVLRIGNEANEIGGFQAMKFLHDFAAMGFCDLVDEKGLDLASEIFTPAEISVIWDGIGEWRA
ncbi:hypothetical protein [Komagataeibacter xylinus]|uniref:Uncharacterized protein n=1 Tax=Komagataeibacter xylinus TaxID=28448 RepID=A0A857FJ04_KOMXY|nr:hypothetical protein [Komagataeibacter xylinus]QHC34143.1 hypothetical protein FMA36_00200 [Komagataeibacter xylinus]